jgi:hypothetical protein
MRAYLEALSVMLVPVQQQGHFKKWLRYYLDFYEKYQFPAEQSSSLPAFIDKFKGKQQSKAQCEQAKQAIAVFHQLSTTPQRKHTDSASPVLPEAPPDHTIELKTTKAHCGTKKSTVAVEYKEIKTGNASVCEPALSDNNDRASLQIAEPESPDQPTYAQQGANWVHLYKG